MSAISNILLLMDGTVLLILNNSAKNTICNYPSLSISEKL
jgi:hypothetical protein